jgi:anti-sigma B factor antagonist
MGVVAGTRIVNGVLVVDLAGRLTLGPEVEILRAELLKAVDRGERRLLLNCDGLTYVDSAGVGELVSAYSAVVRRGGELKLLKPNGRLREVLQITRLDTLLPVCEDEETAVTAFTPASSLNAKRTLDRYSE